MTDSRCSNSSSDGLRLAEGELEKLKNALKLLSEAEKQLRVSSGHSTWFTATLLQLGSVTSPEFTLSGSSKKQSSKTTEEDPSTASRDTSGHKQNPLRRSASPPSFAADDAKPTHKRSANSVDSTSSRGDYTGRSMKMGQANIDGLDEIWLQCIERCHSKTLRQLLHTRGKLLSIGESHGDTSLDSGLLAVICFSVGIPNIQERERLTKGRVLDHAKVEDSYASEIVINRNGAEQKDD